MSTANNLNTTKGRYTGLIVSITLFLTLIAVLLTFTYYTSKRVEVNTVLIQETNSVANSAQAVIKDLFDLSNSYGEDVNSPHIQRAMSRLEENSTTISTKLAAIEQGGIIVDANQHTYDLPTITDPKTLTEIQTAKEQWNLLKPKIDSYLIDASNIMVDSSDQLTQAVEQAKTSSLLMNENLDKLTEDVFLESERQSNNIRLIQILGIFAILTYFLIFIFFFLRRLRQADTESLEARRETQEIMQTVGTGLFLLDKDLNIGQQYSKALADIVGTDRLAGENFTNILRGRISDKDLNTTRQFIEQLYNPRVKEKLVYDLNPLQKVMLHNEGDSGDQSNRSRYLDFKFSRVYEGKDIARILVNVTDVSDAVKLEQRLEQERTQNDMQIEMLTTILNVNPDIINEFIGNTQLHIARINNVLKNKGSSQFELENKLNLIYREIHSLKGEASALKLHSFTKIATQAEEKLQAMKSQGKLSGNDFLPLAVDLDELLNLSNTIQSLGDRINQVAPNSLPTQNRQHSNNITASSTVTVVRPESNTQDVDIDEDIAVDKEIPIIEEFADTNLDIMNMDVTDVSEIDMIGDITAELESMQPTVPNQDLVNYYQDFVQDIAQRQQKMVSLDTSGIETVDIPKDLKSIVKQINIQLLRNAIVHGIETPEVREQLNKDQVGHVSLDMKRVNDSLVLVVQDDGQGINYEAIRQKLIDMGKFDLEKVSKLTQNQLLSVLFSSGFSTKDDTDEDGGRGVGLDIVKEYVKEFDGKLNVKSELNNMTTFRITLPIK